MLPFSSFRRCPRTSGARSREMTLSKQRVSQDELRRRFNEGDYVQRAARGALDCCLVKDNKPESTEEPEASRSYTFECYEPGGDRVFRAHCYVRTAADGSTSYGGSGQRLPDPKVLIEDGVKYTIRSADEAATTGAR